VLFEIWVLGCFLRPDFLLLFRALFFALWNDCCRYAEILWREERTKFNEAPWNYTACRASISPQRDSENLVLSALFLLQIIAICRMMMNVYDIDGFSK